MPRSSAEVHEILNSLEGSAKVADRLRREVLYYIAIAAPVKDSSGIRMRFRTTFTRTASPTTGAMRFRRSRAVRTCTESTNSPSNTASRTATVAYVALNPNAQYIQAGLGARTNAGRNTLQLPGIRNLDFSVFKNFHITEGKYVQLRADLFNAFNHPQFTPGSVNGAQAVSITQGAAANINNIQGGAGVFDRPDLVYSSHPRIIQLALRFNF